MKKKRSHANSAVVIAKLLDTEGFTDYTANRCEQWWLKNRVKTEGQYRRIERLEKSFSELAAKMTQAEKYLLGKFIGLRMKQSFETGIAIGLTVSAVKNSQDVEHLVSAQKCRRCNGNGRVDMLEHCPECGGSGSER